MSPNPVPAQSATTTRGSIARASLAGAVGAVLLLTWVVVATQVSVPPGHAGWYSAAAMVPSLLLSILLLARLPGAAVTRIVTTMTLCNLAGLAIDAASLWLAEHGGPAYSHGTVRGGGVLEWLSGLPWFLGTLPLLPVLLVVFPDGVPRKGPWRLVFRGQMVLLAVLLLLGLKYGDVPVGWLNIVAIILGILLLLSGLARAAALVVLWRRTRGERRKQLRPFVLAAGGLASVYIGFAVLRLIGLPEPDTGVVGGLTYAFIIGGLPTAIALSVLRHRLYGIGVVVNKTLVFVVLAAFITAVYAGIVVGLGRLLPIGEGNLGLAIAATAVVAVAFEPVRERVQHWANRLVYGRRATPYEALAAMTSRIGEAADPGEALAEAARLLAEGSGADRAVVWVVQDRFLVPRGTSGGSTVPPRPVALDGGDLPDVPDSDLVQAVRQDGQLVGALSLRKRPGEGVSTADRRLVEELAGQAALLLANTRLRSRLADRVHELRESRQRMLAAQDRARRSLERDLHDGAQQELVALKVKLGLARTIANREGAAELATQLADTGTIADLAVETLRDVARGIYPPLLESEGLAAALSAQARRGDLAVTVLDRAGRRYPREVEATAYFCALEAVQNAVRHAHAQHAHIELNGTDTSLIVTVTDDGEGFDADATTYGSGLTHMTDRVDSAGGTLTIMSRSGHGTTVSLALPLLAGSVPGLAPLAIVG